MSTYYLQINTISFTVKTLSNYFQITTQSIDDDNNGNVDILYADIILVTNRYDREIICG